MVPHPEPFHGPPERPHEVETDLKSLEHTL
jgi:hypothetical protein